MPRLSAVEAVNPAIQHTKFMLFSPFRFKTWMKIGFIGWLAGAGGGANFSYNSSVPSQPGGNAGPDFEHGIRTFLNEYLLLIIVVAAIVIAVSLVFVYLSCRFRFILFESVLTRDPQIGRGWRHYERQGTSYFGFLVAFMLVCLAVIAVIVGLPTWRAVEGGVFKADNPLPGILHFILPMLLGVFIFVIVAVVVSTLANDFVVPLMAIDDMTVGKAWGRLREMASNEPGSFAGYLGMKLVLSIAFGMAMVFALFLIVLVLAIPAVIITLVVVAAVKSAGTLGAVLGIVAVVIGVIAAIVLFVIVTMLVTAPIAVFFTSYSLYFFGGRYPRLDAILWRQPLTPLLRPPIPPPPLPGTAPAI